MKSNCDVRAYVLLLCLFVCGAATAGIAVPFRERPQVHVLLVGANDYQDLNFPHLIGPERDVSRIARAFEAGPGRLEGRRIMLTGSDATKAGVVAALKHLVQNARVRDTIIVYWAGLSKIDTTTDEVNFYPFDSHLVHGTAFGTVTVTELAAFSSVDNPILFIGDGCNIGDGLVGRLSKDYPYFSVISSTKIDEVAMDFVNGEKNSPLAIAFSEGLQGNARDLDRDNLISAEEMYHFIYPRLLELSLQHASISGRFVHRLVISSAEQKSKFQIESALLEELTAANGQIEGINGKPTFGANFDRNAAAVFLSDKNAGLIQTGLNLLSSGKQQVMVWRDKDKLKQFTQPYKKSRAILIAIDDYDRRRTKASPTGLTALEMMVPNAKKLKQSLLNLGFAENDIITLFDEQATSSAMEATLREFWEGGKYADTDRLVIYFGGHGIRRSDTGYLATYDYDAQKAVLTTFHLADLTQRHANNIRANHVITMLDACYAGLMLPKVLDGGDSVLNDDTLAVIRSDVSRKVRGFFVAGTDDEKAVYVNGGIFTTALISGLRGDADANKDSVIMWDELIGYVRGQVINKSRQTGVSQSPSPYTLDALGKGRPVFVLANTK